MNALLECLYHEPTWYAGLFFGFDNFLAGAPKQFTYMQNTKKKNQIKSNAIEELLEMKCRKPTVSKLPNGRRVLQLKSEQDFFFPPCVSVFPDFKYTTVTSSKCIVFTCILGWVCVHAHFAT